MAIPDAVRAYSFQSTAPRNAVNPFAPGYNQPSAADNARAKSLTWKPTGGVGVSEVNIGGKTYYYAAATTRVGAGSAYQLSDEQAKAAGGVAFARGVAGPSDGYSQKGAPVEERGYLFESAPDVPKIGTAVNWQAGSFMRDIGLGLLAVVAAPFAVAAAAPSGIGYGAGSGLKATVASGGLESLGAGGTLGTGGGVGIKATVASAGLETLGTGGGLGLVLPAGTTAASGVVAAGAISAAGAVKDAVSMAGTLVKEGGAAATAIAGAAKGAGSLAQDAKDAADIIVNLDAAPGTNSGGLIPANYTGNPLIDGVRYVSLDPSESLTAPQVVVTGSNSSDWMLPALVVGALVLARMF